MTARVVLAAAIAAALLAVGFAAGRLSIERPVPSLTCRPSAPERAAIGRRAVLLFGNSQMHDGDWRFPDALAVNCARQGMTLRAGLEVVDRLPDVAPAVVVLGFGAVEALRAAGQGAVIDAGPVAQDMGVLLGCLRARWPGAELIVLGVPPMRPGLLPPAHRSAAQIGPLNAAIAQVAAASGTTFTDPAEALPVDDDGLLATMTHDGVHLTEVAYGLWQVQILAASTRLGAEAR
jgi:hypothetical protein